MAGQRVKLVAKMVCALALMTALGPLGADERYPSERVYVDAGLGIGGVRVGELDFYPAFATATLGTFVWPGIGVEVFGDVGIREGRDDGFELEVPLAYGAALRFESPPDGGLSGYIVLGYAAFEIEQALRREAAGGSIDETFGGARVSIGLTQRFRRWSGWSMIAEYRKYAVDDGLDLDALVIGLRVNAR